MNGILKDHAHQRAATSLLHVQSVDNAFAFYQAAFEANGIYRLTANGRVAFAEMRIRDTFFLLAEGWVSEIGLLTKGSEAATFFLYDDDIEVVFERAVKAGATCIAAVDNTFWGDRCGTVLDPFGHSWIISQHIEDVSELDIKERLSFWLEGKNY